MNRTQANTAYSRPPLVARPTNVVAISSSATRLLITEPIRFWREGVVNRLNELVQLERGWDGYQGQPVSFEIATFTLRMLEAACGFDAPTPQIVPGSSGDIQAEWHTAKGDVELHVKAPNDVHAWRAKLGSDPDGEEIDLTIDFTIVAAWVKELAEP